MHTTVDSCFLCLANNENLKSILSQDSEETEIEKKYRCILKNQVNFRPEVSYYICLDCVKNLDYVYKFTQMCSENLNKLNNYVDTLRHFHGPNKHLIVTLSDLQHLKANELSCGNESANKVFPQIGEALVQEEIADNWKMKQDSISEEEEMHDDDELTGIEQLEDIKYDSNLQYILNLCEKSHVETKIIHEEIHIKDEPLFQTTDSESEDYPNNNLQDAGTNTPDEATDSNTSNTVSAPEIANLADLGDDKQRHTYNTRKRSYEQIFSDNSNSSSNASEYELNETENVQETKPDTLMNVQKCKSTLGKRIWDKKQCCIYCSKMVSKLARHFENVHSNEIEVAKFMALKKKSAARLKIINKLTNKGNFVHNTNIISQNKGTIIAKKRPNSEVSVNDFLPCRFCLAFLYRKTLFIHEKTCKFAKNKKKNERIQGPSSLLLPIKDGASAVLREIVLPSMLLDHCTHVCKNDRLILQYGSKLAHEQHLHVYISQKIRELGRFLLEVRKIDPNIKDLEDLLQTSKLDVIIDSVYSVAGFSKETNSFNIPSLPRKIGQSIQKCLDILLSDAVKQKFSEKEKQIESFRKLYNLEWTNKISKNAAHSIHKKKFNKSIVTSVTSDVQKVHKYTQEVSKRCKLELKNEFSSKNYMILAKVTLAQVILFNGERFGEAQRITVQTYNQRNKIKKNSDVYVSLPEIEKILTQKISRIEILGKRGRCVPIIFLEELEENINLLLILRKQMKIPEDNDYIFATKKLITIRDIDALKFVARGAKIDDVSSLTSNNLRKYIATVFQIITLKDNELNQLANFMGHDIWVHRKFDRLPNDVVQLTKLSKLLIAMQKGTIKNVQDKNLDDIDTPFESDNSSDEEEDTPKKKRNFAGRRPWTEEETKYLRNKFAKNILDKTIPGKRECLECIENGYIQNRPWEQIKYCIYNMNKK